MTVIAWDGKTLAADKQRSIRGTMSRCTKIRRAASGEVLAIAGDESAGLQMVAWYEGGAEAAAWPKCQDSDDGWARLVVFSRDGLKYYDKAPVAITVEDPFAAFGSGMDAALGALAMGASASRAVEIASQLIDSCSGGVDAMELMP